MTLMAKNDAVFEAAGFPAGVLHCDEGDRAQVRLRGIRGGRGAGVRLVAGPERSAPGARRGGGASARAKAGSRPVSDRLCNEHSNPID